ncbi:hypothetical protein [Desulforamulus putei]|uniref:Rubrerythrin diiron-binding domain-containing protein n=1 Tax=Desulforamulus putei DSM 12395 TaxID=1121429 RepID=A0A1M4Y749_9FIRM|nr:hypothetical protein [Desulforamulus putei]SHF01499.1 hypothetical protein SAMN02745133_01623 [Desulforamulus putei DSM 12395]
MAKLTQKDVENNVFKQAYDGEELRRAKYAYLSKTVKDKRLKKIFKVFEMTAQSHLAELRQEMQKLDIK